MLGPVTPDPTYYYDNGQFVRMHAPHDLPPILDWNHILLLGWYDQEGRASLIRRQACGPVLMIVVSGVEESEMRLIDISVPEHARLETIPEEENPFDCARMAGGFYAVGVYVKEGFEGMCRPRHMGLL